MDAPDIADVVALHRRADGVVVSPDVLQAHYERLCQGGVALACRWRAWDDFGEVKEIDLARLADPACDDGDRNACLLLAWADPGPTVDDRIRQLEPLCTAGVARACTDLGVELAADPLARPSDHERARKLHASACAADIGVACRRAVAGGDVTLRDRAVELGDPAFLPTEQACEAGLTSACVARVEQTAGAERLALRERLCWMDDAHCAALLAERASSPGVLLEDRVTRVTWGEGAVLVGWSTAGRWTDHARVDLSRVHHATLHVEPARKEWLVLALHDGTEVTLPERGCEAVVTGAAALAAAGCAARAVAPDGGPAHSVCIDALGPGRGPRYRGGTLTVDSVNGEVGGIGPVRGALLARSDVLYACGEAHEVETDKPWRASFVASRDGSVKKLEPVASTGDQALDTCLATWLSETNTGRRPTPASFVVTVEIPY
jgi:hypothetical protein